MSVAAPLADPSNTPVVPKPTKTYATATAPSQPPHVPPSSKSSVKESGVPDGQRQQPTMLKLVRSAAAAAQYSPSETSGDGYCAIRGIGEQLKKIGVEVK